MFTFESFLFLLFVICNSYFMYRAGENNGKFLGMLHITQFPSHDQSLKLFISGCSKSTCIGKGQFLKPNISDLSFSTLFCL